ncbi:NAD(P)H-quinone oxidoreductase [Microbaculum marinum]|uniref:NAD(P)H-quinone oxidoreductase n=1 Tax=Microbaculum marinum TaxID=1764581 RepID=A0AAW9RYQ6_9HYPH
MTILPRTMTAIEIREPGGPDVLVPAERPVPKPGGCEILVRVSAAGVNRPDVLQRIGVYAPPPGASDIPGLEVAGTVVAVGDGAARFKVGDKVCALLPGGGYAEYCTVDATNALPLPAGLSFTEAAGIPETFFTVWTNVFDRGGLKPGETLLVHGGSSGIGTTAIQLAKAYGATVFVTAGNAEKCKACEDLGADLAIDYKTADFVEAVKQATGGRGVDVILDMVGGDYVPRNYHAAAEDGRIVQIAFLRGNKPTIDLNPLMRKRLTHTGSTLRPRPVEFKADLAASLEAKVWPLIAAGDVKVVMDSTFPLAEAAAAHARLDADHIGKVILETGL